jgi:hypothetical protein
LHEVSIIEVSNGKLTGISGRYGGFHKWRYPKMDGLEWKFPLIDIEVPHILGTAPKK